MKLKIFFALGVFFSLPHLVMAQSAKASASHEALLLKFISAKPISYRADVMFGQTDRTNLSNPSVPAIPTRFLEVRNGILTSLPAVPGAQFAVSDQSKTIAMLLRNYQAQWEDIAAIASEAAGASIAERPIQQLRLVPRDGWRYTRVLWLDELTGVPLKTEIYRKNELIERIQVKKIDFLGIETADSDLKRVPLEANSAPEISMQSMFYVRNVPTGFALTSVFNDAVHVQQIYSDGLARVSVFVQAVGALPATGYTQRGSTGFVVRRNGNVDLVAVGDVPQATLDRFLSGVDVVQR